MASIAHNGQQIFFQDSGGDGPPVLFLHGFLMNGDMFDPQVEALSPAYRCIRMDSRAFGRTVWDGAQFSLYDTVSDAVAVLDALGIASAVIVGMSMGGYAALRMALRHPERVQALVLIGTRHSTDPGPVQAQYIEAREVWRNNGAVPPLVQGLMTAIIGPQEQNAAQWAAWTPRWEAVSGQAYAAASTSLLERDELSDEAIQGITVPSIVFHGAEDIGIPPECGEALHRLLPNSADLVKVPGAGHSVNLTHPDAVNPPLRAFLDRLT